MIFKLHFPDIDTTLAELTPVFVYGSLRRGQGNHGLLHRAHFVRETHLRGAFEMVSLGSFPGVFRQPEADRRLAGELYAVDEHTLALLDRLEGHPRFYERQPVELACRQVAWVYILPAESVADRPVVEGGDWVHRSTVCAFS